MMVGGMPRIRGRSLRKPLLASSNTERHPATAVCPLEDNSLHGPFIVLEVHSEEVVKTVGGDFPGGPVVKNPPASAGHIGSIPGPGSFHTPSDN